MPTYEYRCTECGAELEVTQKFTDPALKECPTCAGPLRKVFNAVGVVFKGSGFYRTDSRNGNGKPDGAAVGAKDAESAKKSTNGDSAKTPSKTANGASANGSSNGSKERAEKAGAGAH
jgi:putative FmdB family regulatory protein